MEQVNCLICNKENENAFFTKKSGEMEEFTLVKCSFCDLEYINPRPTVVEIAKYYNNNYFNKRTDRGYNNYFSNEVRGEIERVMALNLADLGFFELEKSLKDSKRVLDIGSAAGYFVNYMQNRSWDSSGIDLSDDCVNFAKDNGLNVINGDYLGTIYKDKFDLITLWASIEHLHYPDKFLEKIYDDLKEGGEIYISTCRQGGLNFQKLFGSKWRFYNFPEHLYFFSFKNIKKLLEVKGFEVVSYNTYGSGVGKGGSFLRKISDFFAKNFLMGDMMLVGAKKVEIKK